jgi:hypothetical protein
MPVRKVAAGFGTGCLIYNSQLRVDMQINDPVKELDCCRFHHVSPQGIGFANDLIKE